MQVPPLRCRWRSGFGWDDRVFWGMARLKGCAMIWIWRGGAFLGGWSHLHIIRGLYRSAGSAAPPETIGRHPMCFARTGPYRRDGETQAPSAAPSL